MRVDFQTLEWAKEVLVDIVLAAQESNRHEASFARWKTLTGVPFDATKFGNGLDSDAAERLICNAARSHLGQSLIWEGAGENYGHDLKAVRDNLMALAGSDMQHELAPFRPAIRSVTVYLPCEMLSNGSTIIDMPGADDMDPLKEIVIEEGFRVSQDRA
jgi:hypothetical protein